MSFDRIFSVFRIAGSGMSAQRRSLDATADNIANIETTRTSKGGPYIPKRVSFKELPGDLFEDHITRAVDEMAMRRSHVEHYRRGELSDLRNPDFLGYGVEATTADQKIDPVKMVYEPDHPDADEAGYVAKPNISMVKEMTGMMIASRLYEANISILDAAKSMMKKALEI